MRGSAGTVGRAFARPTGAAVSVGLVKTRPTLLPIRFQECETIPLRERVGGGSEFHLPHEACRELFPKVHPTLFGCSLPRSHCRRFRREFRQSGHFAPVQFNDTISDGWKLPAGGVRQNPK